MAKITHKLIGLSKPNSATYEKSNGEIEWAKFPEGFDFDGLYNYVKGNWRGGYFIVIKDGIVQEFIENAVK